MNYGRINSDWVLLLIVTAVGILTAAGVREYFIADGAEPGTAWVLFFVSLIVSAAIYFAILRALYKYMAPWIDRKIAKKHKPTAEIEDIPETEDTPVIEQTPAVDIEKIKRDADQQYIERRNTKINLFQRYAHIAVGPYITTDELGRLDKYIECYASDESLPDDLKPIHPDKLSNPDIFHFGWNMAHYFGKKKQDVAPWLMKAFTPLAELELSYVVGKLHDQQTRKFIIPNIDNIPKYIADQEG